MAMICRLCVSRKEYEMNKRALRLMSYSSGARLFYSAEGELATNEINPRNAGELF